MAKLYQTIYVMPYFISMVIIAVIAYAFLGTSSGFINSVLQSVGADKIQWYSEAKYWPIILIIVYYWKQNGYGAIIYIATITGFDQNIFEAAMIDGASRWQKIRYLTIPMLKQTMVVLTIVSLGGIFKGNFDLFYNVPMNAPTLYPATDVVDTYIYRALSTMPNIGMTTAASFVQSVAGCVTVVVANLIIRKIVLITLLFGGGLAPSYYVTVRILHLKNTYTVLILKGLGLGFTCFMMRSYYATNVPYEIIESGKMDGASEWKIFTRLVAPMAVPIYATNALQTAIGCWNSYMTNMLYVDDKSKVTLQYVMQKALMEFNYIKGMDETFSSFVDTSVADVRED